MKDLQATVEGQGLCHEKELGNGHSGVRRKRVLHSAPWGESVWILCRSCLDSALELPLSLESRSISEMDGRQTLMVHDPMPLCGAEW